MKRHITAPGFRWSLKSTQNLLDEHDYALLPTDDMPKGCQMLEHGKDYTPDDEVIRKLIGYIKHFPKIESIRSNEETKYWMLLVQNRASTDTMREVIKDREGSIVRMQKLAYCGCYGGAEHGSRACVNIRSMSQFLLGDLARIKASLMSGVHLIDIPLWTSLKQFSLNFLNVDRKRCSAVTVDHHDLSVFLLRCRKLTHLRLSTGDDQDMYVAAAEAFTFVLKRLKDH